MKKVLGANTYRGITSFIVLMCNTKRFIEEPLLAVVNTNRNNYHYLYNYYI